MGEYRHANHRRGKGRGSYVRNLWASRRVRDSSAPPQPFLLPLFFGTMPENFSRFIQAQTSPGVILISQELSYREAIEGLLRVWANTEAEDWENVLSFLPR